MVDAWEHMHSQILALDDDVSLDQMQKISQSKATFVKLTLVWVRTLGAHQLPRGVNL